MNVVQLRKTTVEMQSSREVPHYIQQARQPSAAAALCDA